MRTAVVPVKEAALAKARLAGVVPRDLRAALARAMLEHVAGVLTGLGIRTVVLAAEPFRPPEGVEVWPDTGRGLNAELRRALARAGDGALVVPADLPWLRPSDVERLGAEPGDVVVAPTHDGGTGGLLLRRLAEPAFGPGSALAHAARARKAGLRARIVRVEGFERDLDDRRDLALALGGNCPGIPGGLARLLRKTLRGPPGAGPSTP